MQISQELFKEAAHEICLPEEVVSSQSRMRHLKVLEAESIYILRETVAEFARSVMLYSIGKDSSVMLRLAQKAFYPGKIPFPLLLVDTSYKFPEMIEFRDRYTREIGAELNATSLLSAKDCWSVLYATGFVVIYANPSLQPEEQAELEGVAGSRYFDLDSLDLPAKDADAVRQVLLLAESLGTANERQGSRKGN